MSTPTPAPPPPQPPARHTGKQAAATWECEVCERGMLRMSRRSHLRGKPHLARLDAQKAAAAGSKVEKQKAVEGGRVESEGRSAGNAVQEQVRVEAQRVEQKRLAREQQEKRLAAAQDQIQLEAKRVAEHTAQDQIKTEEQRIMERNRRLAMKRLAKEQEKAAEERRRMEVVWKMHEERERERVKREEEEEQRVEELKREELVKKEEERKEAEKLAKEQKKREEECRKKREMLAKEAERKKLADQRKKEEERKKAEELKRAEVQLQLEAAERKRIEEIRIQQAEEAKQQLELLWIKEQRNAEALRIQQEEEQRKMQEFRLQEQEEAEHLAEQATHKREEDKQRRLLQKQQKQETKQQKREEKQRRREEQQRQRQIDEILAREQQALARQAEFPGFIAPSLAAWVPSLGSLMGLQQPGTSVHDGDGETGEDSGYRAKMFQYLESQGIMHKGEGYGEPAEDTYSQASPQPQVLTEYDRTGSFPTPVLSVTDLPPILYRVYDDTSVSKYYWQGFQAGALFMPVDPLNFKHMVQRHGNWNSREGTPFVSVTSSPDAAGWHVAKKQAAGGQTNIMVALIDTAALLGPCGGTVWKMHDAMDHFGLQPWKCERRAYDNEYLCALRIPPQAIFACCQPDYFMDTALVFLKNLEWKEGGKTATRGKTVLTIRPPDDVVSDQAVVSDGTSVPDEALVSHETEADEVPDLAIEEVSVPETDEGLGAVEVLVSEET